MSDAKEKTLSAFARAAAKLRKQFGGKPPQTIILKDEAVAGETASMEKWATNNKIPMIFGGAAIAAVGAAAVLAGAGGGFIPVDTRPYSTRILDDAIIALTPPLTAAEIRQKVEGALEKGVLTQEQKEIAAGIVLSSHTYRKKTGIDPFIAQAQGFVNAPQDELEKMLQDGSPVYAQRASIRNSQAVVQAFRQGTQKAIHVPKTARFGVRQTPVMA